MPTIDHPHRDIELGVPREKLQYIVREPSQGLSKQTGLIFYIHGFGYRYDDSYADKLLPYLADTYNCLAVSVDYQGARGYSADLELGPAPDFFLKLAEHHGVTVTAPVGLNIWTIVNTVCQQLAARGVTRLHPECHTISGAGGYSNFGLLPALDHLQVLGNILKEYAVDKKRLFVLGTSYGGYIGLLLAKLAPNTFRLVVDNSGFSGPQDILESLYGIAGIVGPVLIMNQCLVAFSDDALAPNYLSPSRKMIRDLAVAEHYALPSDTVIYSYHSETDVVAPTAAKKRLAEVLGRARNYDLRLVSAAEVDGRIFKNASHGMAASLRGLFEMSYRRWSPRVADPPAITDFDLETVNRLPCGREDYVLSFDPGGVSLAVLPSIRGARDAGAVLTRQES